MAISTGTTVELPDERFATEEDSSPEFYVPGFLPAEWE